ncbi:hypothetical protein J1614_004961 [Plenodomus biglobosus]|nr:hypothetical protein J1614_004961 [Plenodomus biglobosus]
MFCSNIQVEMSNLIAQQENRANQNIAMESANIAAEAARIAFETKHDSSSMKAIAALTMVFLPFTFVAVRSASPSPLRSK